MIKKITLSELGEMLRHVITHMVTKDDLKEELDPIKATLAEHTQILNDHTRRLNVIENDVKQGFDKRLQLEVRVKNPEEKVH